MDTSQIQIFYETYFSWPLAVLILLVGKFITVAMRNRVMKQGMLTWMIFIAALAISFVFAAIEYSDAGKIYPLKYLITYFTVTSFYDLFVVWILDAIESAIRKMLGMPPRPKPEEKP